MTGEKVVKILQLIFYLFFSPSLMCQTDSAIVAYPPESTMFTVSLGPQSGIIHDHTYTFVDTKDSRPYAIEATLGWRRNDRDIWDKCRCESNNGLLLIYNHYDHKVLGSMWAAAYFVEPHFRIIKNVDFSFRAASGLAYATKRFDTAKNPSNLLYSTTINNFIYAAAGLWFQINDNWRLNTFLSLKHISNASIKLPNKGINWSMAGIALSYTPKPKQPYRGVRSKIKYWKNDPWRFDIGAFTMPLTSVDSIKSYGNFRVLGVTATANKQVSGLLNITLGAEAYRDEQIYHSLKRDRYDGSATRAGLLAGYEVILGKALIQHRLGLHVYDKTPYMTRFYHRSGLAYRFTPQFSAGVSLYAHRGIADFMDFRLLYSIQKKRQ